MSPAPSNPAPVRPLDPLLLLLLLLPLPLVAAGPPHPAVDVGRECLPVKNL